MIPFEQWPEIMTVQDVIRCLDIPRDDAFRLFKQHGFPLVVPGKLRDRRVNSYRLLSYLRGEK